MEYKKKRASVVDIASRRKLSGLRQEPKTNVFAFPIREGEIKTCQKCGQRFYGKMCPDCGPNPENQT